MSKSYRQCKPECNFFRCGQHALRQSSKRDYCQWGEDICSGGTCNYSLCLKRKLLPNGNCALKIRKNTKDEADPVSIENITPIPIRGKLLRRFRKEELF